VLAVLKRFGYDVENLNGSKVHSLYNVLTMEKNVHDWFDRLEMWFERTVSVSISILGHAPVQLTGLIPRKM
jgi:hypothetical protein